MSGRLFVAMAEVHVDKNVCGDGMIVWYITSQHGCAHQ
jgi:hypothetical protein